MGLDGVSGTVAHGPAAGAAGAALVGWFQERESEMLGVLRRLVEQESKSGEEAALGQLAEEVAGWLRPLGEVTLLPEPGVGPHLRARIPARRAEASADASGKEILVIGHLDTVWPLGTLQRKPYEERADGRIYGPGVFDMKAGITILLASLRALRDLSWGTRRPVTILLTCDEEVGSRTSRRLVEEAAQRAAVALVLEPPLPGGIVKTGRKGIATFGLRAIGRASHAGLDPRRGINAIVELAHQILEIHALNDDTRGVTTSVGLVQGGVALNVVPAEAEAKIDARFWLPEDGARLVESIRGLAPALPGAKLEVRGGINRPAMPRSPENLALFEKAKEQAHWLGIDLREEAVGGGSDGNFTAALGVPTLDGLGVDGDGAHAEHEHILRADLAPRAALLTQLLRTL
jgi:glutamate carboxypeptidase